MKSFGLDIGTYSVKVVQLEPKADKYRLISLGMAPLSASFQSEAEVDQKAIAQTINNLLVKTGITSKGAVLALPESQVFSRVVELPQLSEAELKNAIHWEAEQYVPIPLEQANLDYQIIKMPAKESPKEKMEVFLVAAPKDVVQRYLEILKKARLEPVALETELISVCRALMGKAKEGQYNLIVNIGSLSSDLAITRGPQIIYTHSIGTGGNAIARAVARDLNLEVAQAEEYKKSYGLNEKMLEGKVKKAIEPVFMVVIDAIQKAIRFCEAKESVKLKTLLVSGGTAKLPGLVTYLTKALNLEVQVGDPFINIILSDEQKKTLGDDAPLYTTAVGLAMKKL